MNDNTIPSREELLAPPLPSQTRPTRRILVADDECSIRMLLTAVLVKSGYNVESAEDGAEAWEALQAKPYDLLITDHNMPRITGVELVKNMRSAHMALPVVMVAGIVPKDELARDPSLQFSATLSKPFALAELLDSVSNALQMAE
jgi:CheY-like chemotaxis protein